MNQTLYRVKIILNGEQILGELTKRDIHIVEWLASKSNGILEIFVLGEL